ncbi:MAG: acetyl/propionyl/methylcrotonyl-CoA carboxylase subunit alpha [Acetobacteraceae bacterium]
MFRKILIANRGEIACRVARTAKLMGIATAAVYSEADRFARHVAVADEAWPIGPAPARESYLAIEKIIAVARRAEADAIHPGYGFLSENAEFAEASQAAGIVFIGPQPAAIRAMGSKAEAKALMQEAGVPLVPGYHGPAQDHATLAAAAACIGYPVLVKAAAGGGGRGMRVVEKPEDLESALASAAREALAAFGSDRLLLEKYLMRPRHVEIQLFADTHGNAVSLFERDCSIQRRYQKIIEEAPAPGLDPRLRDALARAAIACGRAVGYVGAGTVEFLVAGDDFYFMEMNTRLQVEHAVTEMITGQDLVEWQIRVAAGEKLPAACATLAIHGHAIEARIYAEDPLRDFLPSVGRLSHLRMPQQSLRVRVDSGVGEGDAIGTEYDAMLAKLIAWGEDRAAALRQLQRALAEWEVVGVTTNLGLLGAILTHPEFAAGATDTGFIARNRDALLPPLPEALSEGERRLVLAAAALAVLGDTADEVKRAAERTADPFSPWAIADAWRMNGAGFQDFLLVWDGEKILLRAYAEANGMWRLRFASGSALATVVEDEAGMALRLDGVEYHLRVVRNGGELVVIRHGKKNEVLTRLDPLAPPAGQAGGAGRLVAPIPGRVARILVSAGDEVEKGAALIVLEAMKMELTLNAPRAGVIGEIPFGPGEMVEEGAELVRFAAESARQETG